MRTLMLITFLVLVLATLPALAHGPVMEADIPFSFQAGSKTFPAGHYLLSRLTVGGSWLIRNGDSECYGAFNTFSLNSNDLTKLRLVFHRYQDQYFLREVWTPNGALAVPKSAAEADVQVRAGSPLPVIVAARLVKR
jgi:hypothetical protein